MQILKQNDQLGNETQIPCLMYLPGVVAGTSQHADTGSSRQPLREKGEKTFNKYEKLKDAVYQDFQNGMSIGELTLKFNRKTSSIYRIIGQKKAELIALMSLDYIDSPEFSKMDIPLDSLLNGKTLSGIALEIDRKTLPHQEKVDIDLPTVYLTQVGGTPLLNQKEETILFRQYNYLKYRAFKLREQLDFAHPRMALMSLIERIYQEAIKIKNHLVSANLRLVVAIAKKHSCSSVSFYELISDGNVSLMKAVEKFDYTKGNKFSTYASWALFRNFSRTIPDEQRYRDHFRFSDENVFESKEDHRGIATQEERVYSEQMAQVDHFMSTLNDRERKILTRRYGLGMECPPQTLKQVGKEIGVTKERVRQIELKALDKLRKVARENNLEFPELL
ncbi:MAG: sigma-70 family RNA polymerase sigma factor [Thermoguttaceae bacterium]|nr:sigma-70 family RNA polymerase sigma factor [Thermoguttaceae bacterium]